MERYRRFRLAEGRARTKTTGSRSNIRVMVSREKPVRAATSATVSARSSGLIAIARAYQKRCWGSRLTFRGRLHEHLMRGAGTYTRYFQKFNRASEVKAWAVA